MTDQTSPTETDFGGLLWGSCECPEILNVPEILLTVPQPHNVKI